MAHGAYGILMNIDVYYVERQDVCVYPLLPAMQGVDARLMEQAGKADSFAALPMYTP
jgi:hypothetical protein